MNRTMTGRTAIVTGANGGIGFETARGLARLGAHVVMVCRDPRKGEDARERIRQETGATVDLELAELSDLVQVRALADRLLEGHPEIHVVLLNAGAIVPERRLTPQGYELSLAINHLSPFLLANLLADRVATSGQGRIISVVSDAHRAGKVRLDDLHATRGYSAFGAYANTKLLQTITTLELARRLSERGAVVHAVHPGVVRTSIGDSLGGAMAWMSKLLGVFMTSPEQGARTSIASATSEALGTRTGLYLTPGGEKRPHPAALDRELAGRVWDASARLVDTVTPP